MPDVYSCTWYVSGSGVCFTTASFFFFLSHHHPTAKKIQDTASETNKPRGVTLTECTTAVHHEHCCRKPHCQIYVPFTIHHSFRAKHVLSANGSGDTRGNPRVQARHYFSDEMREALSHTPPHRNALIAPTAARQLTLNFSRASALGFLSG